MKNPKKLESLHQASFSQDFSKVIGGGLNPTKPIPTGDLRNSYEDGKVVDQHYGPDFPKGIGFSI